MQSDKPEPSESKGAECPSTGDREKKAMSNVEAETDKPKGISAVAVLWTFGKCLGALLPVYLAGYYRVSTSLLVFGMMIYTGWKHAREGKETRLKSAIQLLDNEQEYTSTRESKIKRDLPAWVRHECTWWSESILNFLLLHCLPLSPLWPRVTLHYTNQAKPGTGPCNHNTTTEATVGCNEYFWVIYPQPVIIICCNGTMACTTA